MKNKTRYVLGGVIATVLAFTLSACSFGGTSTAVNNDQILSTNILSKFEKSQPAPLFDWSQIRQTLIDVESAQAQSIQTTSFFFNQGVQDPYYVCPSIGFPVASTTQLTNPSQVVNDNGNMTTIPQIDPNGIYSGNSTGTYVLCVDSQGRTYGQYAEGFVHTISGAANWNEADHRIVVTGAPTYKFTTSAPAVVAPVVPAKKK